MKNLVFVALFILLPLLAKGQSNNIFPVAFSSLTASNLPKIDSLIFREFASCYGSQSIHLLEDEIVYLKVSYANGQFYLSALEGTYSKEWHHKTTKILACLEQEQKIKSGFNFIFFRRQADPKKDKYYQNLLQQFRIEYSIPTEVEVFLEKYGQSLGCGPAKNLEQPKNRYLLPERPYKLK